MKFIDSIFWKNYQSYDAIEGNSRMRCISDALILFELSKTYNFKRFLEIGVHQGITQGLLIDACPSIETVGIDKELHLELFNKLYSNKNTNNHEYDSKLFDYSNIGKFDFINVDGDHSYRAVKEDLKNVIPLLNRGGILMLDDYNLDGVKKNRKLLLDNGLVPFIQLEQCELYHYPEVNRSILLDSFYQSIFSNFLYISNIKLCKNTVLKITGLPIINNELSVCKFILEKYDI